MESEDKYEGWGHPSLYDDYVNFPLPDIIVDETNSSVIVRWKRDINPKGNHQYAIKYRNEEKRGKWIIKTIEPSQYEFEITGLQPNSSHRVILCKVYEEDGSCVKLYDIIAKTKPSMAEKLLPYAVKQEKLLHQLLIYRIKPVRIENVAKGVNIITFFDEENDMNRMLTNERNIMFVGCTGAGKTTLVDALFNHLAGVGFTDDFRLQITKECDESYQTNAETTTCYSLPKGEYLSNICRLNIIDTPGFNDINDKDFQMRIIKQVKALLASEIMILHAICVVSPLSAFPLTEAQKSVFNGIFELFANDVNDIMYCLCTFGDSGKDQVLKAFKDEGIKLKAHFKFSNSDLFEKVQIEKQESARKRWFDNSKNFKLFLDNVYKSEGKSVQHTKEVLHVKEALELQLKSLQLNVRRIAQNVINLRQEFKCMEEIEVEFNLGEHFEYYAFETKAVYKRTPNNVPSLNCKTCERTCQENWWALSYIFYPVYKVFKSSLCTICGCQAVNHVRESAMYKLEFEKVLKTDEDLKKKYATAEKAKVKYNEELRKLDMVIKKITNCIAELKRKALRNNELTIADYIETLLKEEYNDMKPGYRDRAKIYAMLQENIECQEPAMKLLD